MSLDYVHKGEAVRASTVNSIIDTIGGNLRMSPDLNVTTTARGPQVSMPSDYGGPNLKPDHILDVGRYMLSGWPMVKLELGFTIGDCLGAMKYYRADGTSSTPVSAAVVYQNSEDCPTGSDISGYALVSSDFGKDAIAHAAGWVDTLIEDPYPGGVLRAQLWKYKSGAELAEVFTNVDDLLSVQQQLSSVLLANGASEEDLSTLKIVGSWSLVESTKLSVNGQESLVPTHEIVCKHGTIDCYEAGGFDYNVVLKASLECIDVLKDDDGEVESTAWAWKIPLGPDATCNEGKARSSSVTYGGNEVLFEVAEGEIGPSFSGRATYNSKAIWYGRYEAEAGEEVEADDVWLNLSYDYQDKATKGVFSSSKDSGSYTQDGILSRNVFVVKSSGFTPGAYVARGDRAPAESLEHGTWGVLPKDGPKLDTYCKKDSTTEFKSLDWADREGEDVECLCAELHEFDLLETVDPLSTDHIVIRRPDDSSGAELKYISLSSLEISGMYVPPDADVPEAQTSSLQTRELSDGSNVEELFLFHLSDTVDVRISDLTSVDIVLRNPNDGQPYVQYGKLCIDIAPDAQGLTGLKSTDWLSDTHELQLYKFDEDGLSAFEPDVTVNSNREYLLPNEYEFVLRKNGAGGEVTYGQVALSVKMEELSGDSQASEQKSISVSNNVIELYKMGEDGLEVSSEVPTHFDEPQSILSDDCEFVIRKGGAGGEIDYTTVKLRQAMLSVDRQGHPNLKSLQYADLGDGTFLELNGFHADGTTKPKVTLTSADTSLLPADNEFLIRRKVNGFWQLEYAPLSVSISGDTLVDSQVLRNLKSLEYISGNDGDYIQLYDMDAAGLPSEQVDLKFAKDSYQDLLPDDEEFVIRTKAGGIILYKNVGVCLSAYLSGGAVISGDNEYPPFLQKSIDLKFKDGAPAYYQLHDMDKAGTSLPEKAITMSSDGYTPLLPSNYEFVLRQNGAGGTITYANLSCCIPDLSALSATIVSGDNEVVVARKSIDFINEPGSDPYYLLHDFLTSAVNGPDTWLKFWDLPLSGEDFSIGCNTEFVVRVPSGNGYEVKYMQLSAYLQHERVDTGTMTPKGRSIDYTAYDEGYGCYNVLELYGFDWGCSHFITSADISSQYGNGILIRKWDDYGCCWQLDYMHFDSLDELAKKYIGDSLLSLSAHNPYRKSVDIYWDYDDNKYYVELWGFQTDYRTASVTIHNDGCTYYWPQDARTDQLINEWDYILVKHVDANGNHTLQYKQLEVQMPDIDSILGDINNIYGEINNFYDEIVYLSGCIDDLSGHLSGDYWEQGGDSSTCYGSSIGNSSLTTVIDLDNQLLDGNWNCNGTFYSGYFDVGCLITLGNTSIGHNNIHVDGQIDFVGGCTYLTNGYFYVDGSVQAGCGFYTGCAYFTPGYAYIDGTMQVGCSIVIGCVSLNEAQLSALLQLVNAPQMLLNL